ncbi:hypothetical protein GCM10018953_03670 [Streptosporangium nondiastaticum]
MASRRYPGAPSWVRPVGVRSVFTGLETAGRTVVVLNFDMRRGPSLRIERGLVQEITPEVESVKVRRCSAD